MDEALALGEFLPHSFRSKAEEDYVAFLWDAFTSNYNDEKYEFASLAFHLLYMSFVSFSLWQIRIAREREFRCALVGFQVESEAALLDADSPFKFYEKLKESQIFRFLKLIGCENQEVGEFAKFVKRRNKIAHPSGTVFFNDKASIDAEIAEMMKEVASIQTHMSKVVEEIYERFLRESADLESREYSDPNQEVEANLVHASYLSNRDIETCSRFDVNQLVGHGAFGGVGELHAAVLAIVAGISDAEAAATT